MQLLWSVGLPLAGDELQAEVATMVVGATDTSANTLSFTLCAGFPSGLTDPMLCCLHLKKCIQHLWASMKINATVQQVNVRNALAASAFANKAIAAAALQKQFVHGRRPADTQARDVSCWACCSFGPRHPCMECRTSIAYHPHVQLRIIQELQDAGLASADGTSPRELTYTDLATLKYLEAVSPCLFLLKPDMINLAIHAVFRQLCHDHLDVSLSHEPSVSRLSCLWADTTRSNSCSKQHKRCMHASVWCRARTKIHADVPCRC